MNGILRYLSNTCNSQYMWTSSCDFRSNTWYRKYMLTGSCDSCQISTKYCSFLFCTLSQRILYAVFARWKSMYCICGLTEVLSQQITKKAESVNRKSVKCHIHERSANLTNYLSPQTCRFAIYETNSRTAHFWKILPCIAVIFLVPIKEITSHRTQAKASKTSHLGWRAL